MKNVKQKIPITYLTPGPNYWVIDLEADDLDATNIWCVVVQNVKSHQVHRFYGKERQRAFRGWLEETSPIFVGHNILSFDVPVLNRLWDCGIPLDRCVDTLVLSYLGDPKRDQGHSLASWGQRLGQAKIDFHDWTEFSPEMLRYCEGDVTLTRQVYEALCDELEDYSEHSAWLEHQSRIGIDTMQRNGVRFDVEAAIALRDRLRSREEALAKEIHEVFPPRLVVAGVYKYRERADGTPYASYQRHVEQYPKVQFNRDRSKYRVFELRPFNIGSPSQRVERLLEIGWKPTQFTPKGNPKVDEDSLVAFAEKTGNEAAKAMAEWLVCNGRANMITTWLENVNESDSRIRPRVFSCGAGTRRMRHTKPNTANIPGVGAPYGHACRSLWTVVHGRRMVGADAAGLEGRVLVHYLGSEEARRFFLEGDPHQSNADAIGCSRQAAKAFFYAFLYGASDKKLGSMDGKRPHRGREIRDALKGNIPGLASLVEAVTAEYNNNGGRLRTIDGGFVRCPSPHAALNYKFQSAGAILMKQAAALLDTGGGSEDARPWLSPYDAFKVLDVHDEWQYDVRADQAHQVGGLMVEAIREAGRILKFNLPMDGEYKIGNNWAETH